MKIDIETLTEQELIELNHKIVERLKWEREANVVLFLAEALCKTRESNRELSTVKMQSRTGCRLSVGSAIIRG